jgi:hypothetical protein
VTRGIDIRQWDYETVQWGDTLCANRRCGKVAEWLAEGLPVCSGCADELLERWVAIDLDPRLRWRLPTLWGDDEVFGPE